jgi:hypothetical protein
MNKIIYNKEYLNMYCNEHNIVLTKLYNNTNRDTKIEGKCLTENCFYDFNKVFRQLVKSGGYCDKCSKIKHQNNIKQDNIYLKQESAKQLGYKYDIWIYNAKKELVEVKR